MNSSLIAKEHQTIVWDKLHAQLNILRIHLINITNKWCNYSQSFTVITGNVKQKLVREVWQKKKKQPCSYLLPGFDGGTLCKLTKVS